jgi:hypothetical protein
MICAAISAIMIGSIAGIASKFPPKCMSALMIGNGLSGVIAAAARVVSLLVKADDKSSALVYFLFADFVLLVCLLVYVYVARSDYFRYYKHYGLYENSELQSKGFHMHMDVLRKV